MFSTWYSKSVCLYKIIPYFFTLYLFVYAYVCVSICASVCVCVIYRRTEVRASVTCLSVHLFINKPDRDFTPSWPTFHYVITPPEHITSLPTVPTTTLPPLPLSLHYHTTTRNATTALHSPHYQNYHHNNPLLSTRPITTHTTIVRPPLLCQTTTLLPRQHVYSTTFTPLDDLSSTVPWELAKLPYNYHTTSAPYQNRGNTILPHFHTPRPR